MKSEPSRTFIGSVLCVDLVGYSKRTVDEQIAVKSSFNRLLSQVIKQVRPDDRIILDTGDGAAVTFLGDPDECLKVGLELRDRLMEAADSLGSKNGEGPVRIGMNLGPLRVALDVNGHPNIIGDGLIACERVMGFAQPGQIVASRGFHEMVSRLSTENGAMFHYEGKKTDKNAREHEIYIVEDRRRVRRAAAAKTAERRAKAVAELQASLDAPAAAPVPAAKTPPAPKAPAPSKEPGPEPPRTEVAEREVIEREPARESALAAFLRSTPKVWATGVVLVAVIFAEAWLLDRKHQGGEEKVAASGPAAMPAKPAEPKAEAKPAPVEVKPATIAAPPAAPPKAEPVTPPAVKAETAARKPEAAPKPQEPAPAPKVDATAAKAERPKVDAPAPKIERPKEPEPPAPGSPAAVAQAAREKADAARAGTAPRRSDEPRIATAKPAPTVTPQQAEPAPPPVVAPAPATAPAPAPAAPPPVQVATTATPITRVPVQFPRAAAQQGLESGTVRARLAINADGRVTNVTVLGSSSRLFDREAIRALEEWRFNAGAAQRTYEVEIEFKR